MLYLHNVYLYLKDVFLQLNIIIINAQLQIVVLLEVTLELEIVCLIYLAKKVKYGVLLWLIVFVLKEHNGMVINVYHVVVEEFGKHLLDVNVLQDISLPVQDAKNSIVKNVNLYLMQSGMVNNAFVIKDFKFKV